MCAKSVFRKVINYEEARDLLEQMQKSKGRLLTGFRDLDALTGGLINGGLTVIGSRPAMGRSALALDIANKVSTQMQGTIAIFSPQLSDKEVSVRLLEGGLSLEAKRLFDGSINGAEAVETFRKFMEARHAKIQIIRSTSPCLEDIIWLCQEISDLRLVIVDNIEYISVPITQNDGTWCGLERESMDQIIRTLKQLAQDEGVPVICTTYLHRRLERRKNKRPRLSDLKWIDLPAEFADQIVFLYRDHYYNYESDDLAECIVAKNSQGDTGTAFLWWIGETGAFADL